MDDCKSTMPDQRLVAAGGEEDHQPHPKTMEHPTSPMDDGKPTKPDIPTVFIKSRHDDGPTSRKSLPEFNPGDLIGRTFLLPPVDNGERIRPKVTRKVAEVIKNIDGERVQNFSYILGIENGKMEEIISYSQLVDHLVAADDPVTCANEDNEISNDLYKFRALIGNQGPSRQQIPIEKDANTMSLLIGRLGRRPMNLSQL